MEVTTTTGNVAPGFLAPHQPQHLEAVHAGHHQIEQDHRRPGYAELVEALVAGLRLAHRPALLGERAAEHVARRRIVVDDEHLGVAALAPQPVEHAQQLVRVERLGQVLGGAERDAHLAVAEHGDQDDRDLAAARDRS